MPADKAAVLAGTNPDYSIADLYNSIADGKPVSCVYCYIYILHYFQSLYLSINGEYLQIDFIYLSILFQPSWTLHLQIMTLEQAKEEKTNPFDLTKIWPHERFPLIPVGKMVLNRNPTNYFADVEQSAYSPAHMPVGVEASPDKMLQVSFS